VNLIGYLEFLNNWAFQSTFGYTTSALDTRLLRGGPAMEVPSMWYVNLYARSDPSKDISGNVFFSSSTASMGSGESVTIQPNIQLIPFAALRLSLGLQGTTLTDQLQYVDAPFDGRRTDYVLARLMQHTVGATFRIDYSITTELTVQYYGSPFVSVGRYSEFKRVNNPRAGMYDGRFVTLSPSLVNGSYEVAGTDDGSGAYSFANPDFSFRQFRSNLVVRWEFRPGSALYLVWGQDRTAYDTPGAGEIGESMDALRSTSPENVFLAKCSYWFSL
jgi:hypothetical protein